MASELGFSRVDSVLEYKESSEASLPSEPLDRHENKQASFLGLPAEIRLQIYSYLLVPYTTPSQQKDLKYHCCAFPHHGRNYNRYNREDAIIDVACDCKNKSLHPSVLRVNKQIFHEARDVLWENMELQVRLPFIVSFLDSPLTLVLAKIPSYARKSIRRLSIVGTPGEASEPHREPDRHVWRYPLQQYADTLTSTLPRLTWVRLHIDFGSAKTGGRLGPDCFGYIVDVPSVREVEVFVDGAGMPSSRGSPFPSWQERMSGMVCDGLRGRVEALGRGVCVREVPYVEDDEEEGV